MRHTINIILNFMSNKKIMITHKTFVFVIDYFIFKVKFNVVNIVIARQKSIVISVGIFLQNVALILFDGKIVKLKSSGQWFKTSNNVN